MAQGRPRHRKRKSIPRPLVFKTTDVWGSAVHCTQSNWDMHIIVEHPDMQGRADDVKKTIEDPDRVSPSTFTGLAFGHEKTIESETIRAIVYYDDPAALQTGRTTGNVGTAYIVDTVNFASRIGTPIYVKEVSPSPPPHPITEGNEGKEGGNS
jgi:hypothetical protein